MAENVPAPRGLIRQGDVLLVPVDPDVVADGSAPSRRRVIERVGGRLVLAEGEATGHAHAIVAEHARLELQEYGEWRQTWVRQGSWSDSRTVLIIEREPVALEHEEHDTLSVPPGAYLVQRQREYVPRTRERGAGWRGVAD